MSFAIPKIRRETRNHTHVFYFWMVDISRFRKTKNRHVIAYPSVRSSFAPVSHDSKLPLPKPPGKKAPENSVGSQDIEKDSSDEFNISHTDINSKPPFPNQQELDDLVRDMRLTVSNAKLLTSSLKEWTKLDLSCRCLWSRKRHERFSSFF